MAKPLEKDYLSFKRIKSLGIELSALPHEFLEVCDLCGSTQFAVISWMDRYMFNTSYMMCLHCGLVFLNPRPTEEGYSLFYEGIYRKLVGTNHDKLVREETRYAKRLMRFLSHTRVLKPGMKAIDVGGSLGITASMLRNIGVECSVLDPAPDELKYAANLGLKIHQGFAETWVSDEKYDLVLITRTVDHLRSIRKALDNAYQWLKEDGYLFVDFVDFYSRSMSVPDYRQLLKVDHPFYLSYTTMEAYLTLTGFYPIIVNAAATNVGVFCRKSEPAQYPFNLDFARGVFNLLRQKYEEPIRERPLIDKLLIQVLSRFSPRRFVRYKSVLVSEDDS